MKVILSSMVNVCAEMNANTVPSSQRIVVVSVEDPDIVMLPPLEMMQGLSDDMRCSPPSNTTAVLDIRGL